MTNSKVDYDALLIMILACDEYRIADLILHNLMNDYAIKDDQ